MLEAAENTLFPYWTFTRIGGLVSDFVTRFGEASEQLGEWVASGDLTHRETIVNGLENAPDAFLGLFSGDNIGK